MANHPPPPPPRVLLLSLAVSFLVVVNGCLVAAEEAQPADSVVRPRHQRFRGGEQDECQLSRLNSLEPTNRIQCEAGVIESWDPNEDEFRCAGVAVVRHIIEPNGLLLPSFTNAPQLIYVVEGRGMQGLVLPGCPETFQSSQQSQFGRHFGEREEFGERGGQRGRQFRDQHQKIRRFREGDILVVPNGAAHWLYNDGNRPIVAIVLLDTANNLNQLDLNPRRFYLAGNPEEEHPSQGERGRHSLRPSTGRGGQGGGGACRNIFCGIDAEFLAEAFNVDLELARRLHSEMDSRNGIVSVEGRLQVLRPPRRESELEREGQSEREQERYGFRPWERESERYRRSSRRESERYRRPSRRETEWESESESERYPRRGGRGGRYNEEGRNDNDPEENGLEETICTMRLRENIGDRSRADIYTPQAGRINTLNSQNLPILFWLQLSAEHGLLHNNAMMVPHWNLNAHSVIYVIRGQARVQVVDNNGQAVFDQDLQEGRILVVPQNFAVVKRAESEEFEWVSFKTSDNAMINPVAGRTSFMRALPDEVVANAYQISREEARRLKYNREGTTVFRAEAGSMFERRAEA